MKNIPPVDLGRQYLHMKEEIDRALAGCLEHQRWILGPEVGELEEALASYLGVGNCIGVSSGTEALVLALRGMAIQRKGREYWDPEDVIITTPFTFTATGDAILRAGATPLFLDIEPGTFNIDVGKVSEYLEWGEKRSRVVGLLPVHLYGLACRMEGLRELAGKHDIFILEDTAQGIGGKWKDDHLGTLGNAGAFSFFPTKNLGGFGDGGLVATEDEGLAELVRMLLRHGGRDKYNVDHIGYNARLDTIQAAVLKVRLRYLEDFNRRRKALAGMYTEYLDDVGELILPRGIPEAEHVYHQYTVRVTGGRRDALQAFLREEGVGTMIYYPVPLHRMKVFRGRCLVSGGLEKTEAAVAEVLSIPIDPLQSVEETRRVAGSIRTGLERGGL